LALIGPTTTALAKLLFLKILYIASRAPTTGLAEDIPAKRTARFSNRQRRCHHERHRARGKPVFSTHGAIRGMGK